MSTPGRAALILIPTLCLILLLSFPVTAVNVNIDYGTSSTGAILAPGAVDTYTFSGEQGDTVVVRIAKTKGDIWPRITLYGPAGQELARKDSSTTSEIVSELAETGAYRILVDDGYQGSHVGSYTLFVQRTNAPKNTIPFEIGTAKAGSIDTAGTVDTYSFEGGKGDGIVLRISKTNGDIWPRITLYGPSGAELKRADSSTSSEIAMNLKESGTHTILVDDGYQGSHTGDYSLFCQVTSGPGAGVAGQAVAGATISTSTRATQASSPITTRPTPTPEPGGKGGFSDYLPFAIAGVVIIGVVVVAGRKLTGRPSKGTTTVRSGPRTTAVPADARSAKVIDHDVFISYASEDKPTADAVCSRLENRGIRCWIAPRDVVAGSDYREAIVDAIETSEIMVLIYSSHANKSKDVNTEAALAFSKEVIIIPFKVDNAPLSKSLEYLMHLPHWIDAMTPPLKDRIDDLIDNILTILTTRKKRESG
jgi:hypothetical protein